MGDIKHTMLPWKIEAGEIVGLDGTEVGTVFRTEAWYSGEAIESEDQANAAFIELACNSHYELLEAMKTALSEISQGLGLVNHKFERAGGILGVAHKGVELGAMSWASNVSNGLHNASLAIETLTTAIAKAEGK